MQASYISRIFHHISDKLAEKASVHIVHLLILPPYFKCLFIVLLDKGIKDFLDNLLHQPGEARNTCRRLAPAAVD